MKWKLGSLNFILHPSALIPALSSFPLTLPPDWRKKREVLTPFRGVPVMKRMIALVALLCAASACTTTTENTNTGAGNANAAATATPAAAGPTQADIEAKERQ